MRHVGSALLLALSLLRCSGGEAEPAFDDDSWPEALNDEGLVVEWHARDRWGHERFELHRDGAAAYRIVRAGMPELAVDRAVSTDELEGLRDRLVELECCSLESDPRASFAYGASEGLLRVRLPGVACDVHRALHRWDDEATVRCDEAVRQLHGRIRPRGTEPEAPSEGSAGEAPAGDEAPDEQEADEPVGDVPPG